MGQSRDRHAEYRYRPAWWLPGGHAQTIWGRVARPHLATDVSVECLSTPDGDNLEIHSLAGRGGASQPHVLMLHGLEGSVRSHYVGGVFDQARQRGWHASLITFRGCGSAPNVARRFYHSGETSDVAFAFHALSDRWPDAPWLLAGVSLGGNVLLRWLGDLTDAGSAHIRAAAAISVPYDLEAGARNIARGFARIYDRAFLKSLRRKAMAKLELYPDLFIRERLERARNVIEFDDAVTAPVHGFEDASDYYTRCSSIHSLPRIRVPTLLLSARDDPFLPRQALNRAARAAAANPALQLELHDHGGHVGFVAGARPWHPFYYAEWRVFRFFDSALERA